MRMVAEFLWLLTLGGSPMKVVLGALIAAAGAIPAVAFSVPAPAPAPAPDLGVGIPAVLAVIAAYVIARLVIRRVGAGLPSKG